MILHCTQKMAGKLAEVSAAPFAEASPLGSWHANLLTIDRRLCVIFCHDATRYSLFLPGLSKVHFATLGRMHREFFLATLATLGVKGMTLHRVAMAMGPTRFDRATDRSVLGSMRMAGEELRWLLPETNVMDCDPLALSVRLNDRPATVKGKWISPDKEMLALVERICGKNGASSDAVTGKSVIVDS